MRNLDRRLTNNLVTQGQTYVIRSQLGEAGNKTQPWSPMPAGNTWLWVNKLKSPNGTLEPGVPGIQEVLGRQLQGRGGEEKARRGGASRWLGTGRSHGSTKMRAMPPSNQHSLVLVGIGGLLGGGGGETWPW